MSALTKNMLLWGCGYNGMLPRSECMTKVCDYDDIVERPNYPTILYRMIDILECMTQMCDYY